MPKKSYPNNSNLKFKVVNIEHKAASGTIEVDPDELKVMPGDVVHWKCNKEFTIAFKSQTPDSNGRYFHSGESKQLLMHCSRNMIQNFRYAYTISFDDGGADPTIIWDVPPPP